MRSKGDDAGSFLPPRNWEEGAPTEAGSQAQGRDAARPLGVPASGRLICLRLHSPDPRPPDAKACSPLPSSLAALQGLPYSYSPTDHRGAMNSATLRNSRRSHSPLYAHKNEPPSTSDFETSPSLQFRQFPGFPLVRATAEGFCEPVLCSKEQSTSLVAREKTTKFAIGHYPEGRFLWSHAKPPVLRNLPR